MISTLEPLYFEVEKKRPKKPIYKLPTAIKEITNCRNCGANTFKHGKCEYCNTERL